MNLILASNLFIFSFYVFQVYAKTYEFKHAYDPENKYGETSVHFDNMAGLRYECLVDIQKEIISAFKPFLSGKQVIGYADPAVNHNLGDQLLWAGSNKLFQRFGKAAIFHCGGSQSKTLVPSCLDKKQELINDLGNGKGIIWFNPGGNWGDLYRHVQMSRFEIWKIASENKIPFIQGPQSIYYDPDKKKGAERDDQFVKEIGSKKDALSFRQHDSFLYAETHYGNSTNVIESPDMAFMLGPQVEHDKTILDVFLLVRRDTESRMIEHLENYDKICKGVISKGYTCAIGDWGTGSKINRHKDSTSSADDATGFYSDIGLQLAISTISLGELIVTDRLHGAILGFLLGKTVIYIDNSYKKLASVFSTAFKKKLSCADTKTFGLFEATNLSVLDLEKHIIKLLAKKRVN